MSEWNFISLEKDNVVKMENAINAFKKRIEGLNVGIAKPSLLSNVRADFCGNKTPINQLSSISSKSSTELSIQVWDKNNVHAVNKAISLSDLGLTSKIEGNTVYATIPSITTERRLSLIKILNQYSEESKISIRGIRRVFMDEVKSAKKSKIISDNEERSHSKKVQQITDKYVDQISKICDEKSKVIMGK